MLISLQISLLLGLLLYDFLTFPPIFSHLQTLDFVHLNVSNSKLRTLFLTIFRIYLIQFYALPVLDVQWEGLLSRKPNTDD